MVSNVGKVFIFIGLFFILLGLGFIFFSHFKIPFLGKLPGDIFIKRDNFIFYFPITTSLLISMIISFILFFIFRK